MSVLSLASNYHNIFSWNYAVRQHKWGKPDPRYVKVNVDAAFFEDAAMGAIVAVLRDDKSNFLAAQCKFIPNAAYVVNTEAMAMRDGLGLANSLGFNRVEAESDSL